MQKSDADEPYNYDMILNYAC